MVRKSLEAEYRVITQDELDAGGYASMVDMLRDEWADEKGPSAGFYDGVNGTNSLNLGLNDRAHELFRESTRSAIKRLFPDMRKDSDT